MDEEGRGERGPMARGDSKSLVPEAIGPNPGAGNANPLDQAITRTRQMPTKHAHPTAFYPHFHSQALQHSSGRRAFVYKRRPKKLPGEHKPPCSVLFPEQHTKAELLLRSAEQGRRPKWPLLLRSRARVVTYVPTAVAEQVVKEDQAMAAPVQLLALLLLAMAALASGGRHQHHHRHRHGRKSARLTLVPAAPGASFSDRARDDRHRHAYIRSTLAASRRRAAEVEVAVGASAFAMPLSSGAYTGTGQYFVRFRVGTPAQPFVLVADTGSDLTWVKCRGAAAAAGSSSSPAASSERDRGTPSHAPPTRARPTCPSPSPTAPRRPAPAPTTTGQCLLLVLFSMPLPMPFSYPLDACSPLHWISIRYGCLGWWWFRGRHGRSRPAPAAGVSVGWSAAGLLPRSSSLPRLAALPVSPRQSAAFNRLARRTCSGRAPAGFDVDTTSCSVVPLCVPFSSGPVDRKPVLVCWVDRGLVASGHAWGREGHDHI
ncbi:hypothetical protein HU200_026527 [Digitaria exilis]|uniref:Peptidase A1 domain-containing protein n=1 Tax=Digitaria exilis TaxID=1010633 RepID=A0A835EUE9_9POAL|nr:hypothetical protein HU200_026527 [Digitaria exilis]